MWVGPASPLRKGPVVAPIAASQPKDPVPAGRDPELELGAPWPRPLTSFIGREDELAAIEAALAREDVQVLTLTGPGGIGKSRIALQVAARQRARYIDGVVFVPLAAVHDPELVVPAIVRQVLPGGGDRHRNVERLIAFLEDRQFLLVLDNFEQVIAAASELTPLLERCTRLKLLVTSRIRLHVSGEHMLTIPPLSVLAATGDYPPAVRLFIARADVARTGFADGDIDAPVVTAICARLDGLPLAIELAAARVAQLPPRKLLARLAPSLPILTGGARDLPERHQTMRAAIAWSYELLPVDAQRCLRWLAVFVGGFTLEAAETVGAALDERLDVLAGVATLVDHSLLRFAEGQDAEPRYIMLEMIREFALDELESHGEAAAAHDAHARWLLAVAEKTDRLPTMAWLDQMDAERGNQDAALTWLAEAGDHEPLLRLVAALGSFWDVRGPVSVGLRWMDAALTGTPAAPGAARIRALSWAGLLDRSQGNLSRAYLREEEALSEARAFGEPDLLADALHSLAQVLRSQGDLARASACFEESLAIFRGLGDGVWVIPLVNLGIVALQQGETDLARERLETALEELRRAGRTWGAGFALRGLAGIVRADGDLARARDLYTECISLWRAHGFPRGIGYALVGLVTVLPVEQPARTARIVGAAERIREDYGFALWPAELAAYDRVKTDVTNRLAPAAFRAAWDEGARMTPEEAIAEVLALAADAAHGTAAAPSLLTPRELDILRLLVEGKRDREIAAVLSLSHRTVSNHVLHILTKLGVESRTAAAAYALRHGLL